MGAQSPTTIHESDPQVQVRLLQACIPLRILGGPLFPDQGSVSHQPRAPGPSPGVLGPEHDQEAAE